jgi:uncharacterized phage protein (TIGR01671 family)
MREMKFRCWDGEKMWYPETLSNDNSDTYFTFFNKKEGTIGWGLYDRAFENRICSGEYDYIMQFTGLKDKNGKKIYEGDIVWLLNIDKNGTDDLGEIKFDNGSFWFQGKWFTTHDWHFYNNSQKEILGNIYENPNLIKELL